MAGSTGSDSLIEATRDFACSTNDAFSASEPAAGLDAKFSDGFGCPDESVFDASGLVGSSEPGCFESSDIDALRLSTLTLCSNHDQLVGMRAKNRANIRARKCSVLQIEQKDGENRFKHALYIVSTELVFSSLRPSARLLTLS